MIPYIHAELSAKRYGGVPEDYIDIHQLLDSSKATVSDNRHRFLTHNSFFTTIIIPKVFGEVRTNSAGRRYNTKDVAEYHVLEDFRMRFIPTPQDYVEHMTLEPWMNNGMGVPNRLKRKNFRNRKNYRLMKLTEEQKLEIKQFLLKLKEENPELKGEETIEYNGSGDSMDYIDSELKDTETYQKFLDYIFNLVEPSVNNEGGYGFIYINFDTLFIKVQDYFNIVDSELNTEFEL
jgi:hypothetical protein